MLIMSILDIILAKVLYSHLIRKKHWIRDLSKSKSMITILLLNFIYILSFFYRLIYVCQLINIYKLLIILSIY